MKTSEAFKLTLAHLWDGKDYFEFHTGEKQKYICIAAMDAGVNHIVAPIIHKLLGEGCESYEYWLSWYFSNKGHKAFRKFQNEMLYYPEKLQRSRKLWLEHLIKHYESIGD